MRRFSFTLLLGAALTAAGCEDGPEKVFTPFDGDPAAQNGYSADNGPWTQEGGKSFTETGGDSVGRAKFCDESQVTELVQWMVTQPIIPDVSIGGVPMWAEDGGPLHADDLIGLPEDGKFCDPTGLYADAFTWGPTDDVIVFFDPETRLVDGVVAYTQYLGTMQGHFTNGSGEKIEVVVQPRERLKIGGVELDRYASRADAPSRPDSWLNNANVTAVYKMVRETFFGADPVPDDFDCVAEQICDLIYTASNESVPQDTFILIQDSGIQIRFTPEGQAIFVYLVPVRAAPFEQSGSMAFGAPGSSSMRLAFDSERRQGCTLDLDDRLTWAQFQATCIASGDERSLDRVNYNVEDSRDAVQVEFNGMDLGFLRRTSESAVFRDGERPNDDDILYGIGFTRTLNAPVEEFRAQTLGNLYKARLEQRLRDSIVASGVTTTSTTHPFYNYNVNVPFTSDEPQRIGELLDDDGNSWIPQVLAQIEADYQGLTKEQQEMLDARVLDTVYLIEPFTDAVLFAFSHGMSEHADAFKAFRTTDDRRWSIGYAHFKQGGVPYRLNVQYSLNFGAITAVFVERGTSEIDDIINFAAAGIDSGSPYYEARMAQADSSYSLGGNAIGVRSFDRQLGTLEVLLQRGAGQRPLGLNVTGEPIEDNAGYFRQLRGERSEFIRAHEVAMYGKETVMLAYVREDGTIGRINIGTFKGTVELCDGLGISYGDDVRAKIEAWEATVTANDYRDCELVFNYSANRNVLDSITSIANRTSFVVVDGRAVTVSQWL